MQHALADSPLLWSADWRFLDWFLSICLALGGSMGVEQQGAGAERCCANVCGQLVGARASLARVALVTSLHLSGPGAQVMYTAAPGWSRLLRSGPSQTDHVCLPHI